MDFDLNGFYDNMNQVIFLTKYDIPADSLNHFAYFAQRKELLSSVVRVAKENDLLPSGDSIEDYGEWFYFVRSCGESWREAVKEPEEVEKE